MIKNSIRILNQIRRYCTLPDVSVHTPIAYNHWFKPSELDLVFAAWRNKGLKSIEDLYVDEMFASFSQLQSIFNLPGSDFFRYLQIRHYVKEVIPQFVSKPKTNTFDECIVSNPTSRHLISRFVNVFPMSVNTNHLKEAWAKDFGVDLSDEIWNDCLSKIQYCSINARQRLIQFKAVHRLYYSKVRLNKIYNTISPICDRCKVTEGTLSHLFWFCPNLFDFWSSIFDFFSKVFQKVVKPDPILAILGTSGVLNTFSSSQQQSLLLGMVLAKKIILLNWKSSDAPFFKTWLSELFHVIRLEDIRLSETKSHCRFQAGSPSLISSSLSNLLLCKTAVFQQSMLAHSIPCFFFFCLFFLFVLYSIV